MTFVPTTWQGLKKHDREGSLRATKEELSIGTNRMYILRDETGSVTKNMDEIMKIAERF